MLPLLGRECLNSFKSISMAVSVCKLRLFGACVGWRY